MLERRRGGYFPTTFDQQSMESKAKSNACFCVCGAFVVLFRPIHIYPSTFFCSLPPSLPPSRAQTVSHLLTSL